MISYALAALTALNLDCNVSSVNMRDIVVLVIALAGFAALVVVGSPYTPGTPFASPSISPSTDSPSLATDDVRPPTSPKFAGPSPVEDEFDVEPQCSIALEMAPFSANLDDSLWSAEYKTGLGLTFKDSEIVRRMNMVSIPTTVYEMDDDFFDFSPPRAGHVEGVEFEELLLDDGDVDSSPSSGSSSSLGYWDSMGDSEREFKWRTEYGDDSWLFDRPLYREEEKKSVWRRIRSGLKKKVLRRRF